MKFLGTEEILKNSVARQTPAVVEALMLALCAKKTAAHGVKPSTRLSVALRAYCFIGVGIGTAWCPERTAESGAPPILEFGGCNSVVTSYTSAG